MLSPSLDRLLRAAMKRRFLDTIALQALVKATHLLVLALAERLRRYRDHGDPVFHHFAQLEEQSLQAALLREALEILGSRWDKLPEHRRPHYTPEARFRILTLKALLALSAGQAAQTFRVSIGTILRWEQEAQTGPERETVGSLLKPIPPVCRYADVVRHLIQTMARAGFPGDRSVALCLARAGWRLSRRTVQRVRRERPAPPPALRPPTTTPRAVRPRFPNHVWMLDLTEIPGLFRLFSFKLAVVFDAFSRVPLTARVFLSEPRAKDIARLFAGAVRQFGPSRHCVSDRGVQFTSGAFRHVLRAHRVQQRYGAVGKTGSIALIERFFRTLKATAGLRARPPLVKADLEQRLALAFDYYVWLRPHQGLGGATPAERFLGHTPAHGQGIPLPRGRPGEPRASLPPFEIHHLDPEQRLPYLVHKAA